MKVYFFVYFNLTRGSLVIHCTIIKFVGCNFHGLLVLRM